MWLEELDPGACTVLLPLPSKHTFCVTQAVSVDRDLDTACAPGRVIEVMYGMWLASCKTATQ